LFLSINSNKCDTAHASAGETRLTSKLIYAIFLLTSCPEHGAVLIQETKTKSVAPDKGLSRVKERRIPSLQSATDPSIYVAEELQLVEQTLLRAIRSRE